MTGGSQKCFWRDSMKLVRQTTAGRDPVTLLDITTSATILDEEPCDLAIRSRTVPNQTDAGTNLLTVKKLTLRLEPALESQIPDENDQIYVNNQLYTFGELLEVNHDPATGRFQGAVISLQAQAKVP